MKQYDFYRHLIFASAGGYFGAYALLAHGSLASAQTLNMIMMTVDTAKHMYSHTLMCFGCLLVYIAGVASTVIIPHCFGLKMCYVSPAISIVCAIISAYLPADIPPIIALYPIFFAMSVQWTSFQGTNGFTTATIFSTNNLKQLTLALTERMVNHDKKQKKKIITFSGMLLAFHIGVFLSYSYFKVYSSKSILFVIPILILATIFTFVAEHQKEIDMNQLTVATNS